MVKPHEDLNATLFEDSVMLYDAGNNEDEVTSMQPGHVCIICKKNQNELTASNPLVHFCPTNKAFAYCKTCLDEYVQSNTRMAFKSNGVIHYSCENLVSPDTGTELPRFFRISGKTHELVSFPKLKRSPYILFERVNYDRSKGSTEGFVIRFESPTTKDAEGYTVGGEAKADCHIPGLSPLHFIVMFRNSFFYLADFKHSSGTYIKPYNSLMLGELKRIMNLLIYDHYLTITLSMYAPSTKKEFQDNDTITYFTKKDSLIEEESRVWKGHAIEKILESQQQIDRELIISENLENELIISTPTSPVPRFSHKLKLRNN